jgi:hypothetical protein
VTTQQEKGEAFRELHLGEAFIIPNPWDAGSAKVFAGLGFKALATTSAGFAFTLGRRDGDVTLDEVIDHTRVLDDATSLPVSVDLENGYGPSPEQAALAITRAAEAGAVGGSIEDYDPDGGIYDINHAVERVAAAGEAAKQLGFPFTLTARAENFFRRNPDRARRRRRPLCPRAAERRADPSAVGGHVQAPERARASRPVDERDRRGRGAAGQRRKLAGDGGDQRSGGCRQGDAGRGRLLGPARAGRAQRVARRPLTSSPLEDTSARRR